MVNVTVGPENALDHVVVLMFENRSFDNLLGRLYEPGEVASFEGVLGRELSNPIPEWAEDSAERSGVAYGVARPADDLRFDEGVPGQFTALGHNDMHPPFWSSAPGLVWDPPSSILGGEGLLARVYDAIRSSSSPTGSNPSTPPFW